MENNQIRELNPEELAGASGGADHSGDLSPCCQARLQFDEDWSATFWKCTNCGNHFYETFKGGGKYEELRRY